MNKINTVKYKNLIEDSNVAIAPWYLSFLVKVFNNTTVPIMNEYKKLHYSDKEIIFGFSFDNTFIEKRISTDNLNEYIINFDKNFISTTLPLDEHTLPLSVAIYNKIISSEIAISSLSKDKCTNYLKIDPEFILNNDGSITLNLEIDNNIFN